MVKFLFGESVVIDSESKAKISDDVSKDVLRKSLAALELLTNWSHDSIDAALRAVLIEEMGLKPRIAFGAVRIAVTGSHISPPLFESMELLGKERAITRIKNAI
jgi:glutamyl-tRNA synthetase